MVKFASFPKGRDVGQLSVTLVLLRVGEMVSPAYPSRVKNKTGHVDRMKPTRETLMITAAVDDRPPQGMV